MFSFMLYYYFQAQVAQLLKATITESDNNQIRSKPQKQCEDYEEHTKTYKKQPVPNCANLLIYF